MLDRLFPRQFGNAWSGSRIAAWLLGTVIALKAVMGFNSVFFTRMVAVKADGIPLDSYGPAGARMVTVFFAQWGLGQMLLAFLGLVALVRYRSMIPLVLLLLLTEQLARKAIFMAHPPVAAVARAPGLSVPLLFNLGFTVALLAAFALSLTVRRAPAEP